MRIIRVCTIGSVALWLSISQGQAQGVQQQIGMNGSVNYTECTITATGIGLPGTIGGRGEILRAAKDDALGNLLKVIYGIALTSSLTVEDQIRSNPVMKSRIEGIAKTYRQVGREKIYDDGSLEVTIELGLAGPLLDALLPSRSAAGQRLSNADAGSSYTGLIIDAKGLGARPALAPRILDEQGREVYGPAFAGRDWAVRQGMAGYVRGQAKMSKSDRAGDRPLVVRGIRTSGVNAADIIISNQDAQRLHGASQNLNALEQCRVMIILD